MTQIPHDLMTAILDNHACDLPRLISADWLEEHGESERAEFVRLQCNSGSKYTVFVNDVKEALPYSDWFGSAKGFSIEIRRGFPDSVRCTMADFMPGECGKCQIPEIDLSNSRIVHHKRSENFEDRNVREITFESNGTVFWNYIEATVRCFVHTTQTTYNFIVKDVDLEFRDTLIIERAVLQVIDEPISTQDCYFCHGTGKHPGLAAVIGGWPVARIEFSDRQPMAFFAGDSPWLWSHIDNVSGDISQRLPGELFELLKPRGRGWGHDNNEAFYPTRELAISALSDAAVRYARGEWEKRDGAASTRKNYLVEGGYMNAHDGDRRYISADRLASL